jgi:hypothetical protein
MATVKKKMQAGGVSKKSPKAPMVDPKGAWTKVQERTLGNMKKGGALKKQAAVAIAMKKAGKAPKKMMQYGGAAASMVPPMKMGGSLKPVDKAKNPGLSKLPTPVRNKMGYQKTGGKTMLKRADGSYSQRGLWDNLRSKAAKNKATGAKPKAPTKSMLTQEKKIKAKKK